MLAPVTDTEYVWGVVGCSLVAGERRTFDGRGQIFVCGNGGRRLVSAPSYSMKPPAFDEASGSPRVSPLERRDQGPTGGRLSRGEGEKGDSANR